MGVTGRDDGHGQPLKPSELIKWYTSLEEFDEAVREFMPAARCTGLSVDEAVCVVGEVLSRIKTQGNTIDDHVQNLDSYIKSWVWRKALKLRKAERREQGVRRLIFESGHFQKSHQQNMDGEKAEYEAYLMGRVQESVAANPPKHLEVFLKYHIEGFKLKELAGMFNVDIGTVSRWIKAACKHIKKDLKERFGLDDWGNSEPSNSGDDDS